MKLLNPFTVLPWLFITLSIQAQTLEDFDRIDTNDNGLLSIEEARAEFSDQDIVDSNNDSLLNHAEAEAAIDGLVLPTEEAGDNAVVGASDYMQIYRALFETEQTG